MKNLSAYFHHHSVRIVSFYQESVATIVKLLTRGQPREPWSCFFRRIPLTPNSRCLNTSSEANTLELGIKPEEVGLPLLHLVAV